MSELNENVWRDRVDSELSDLKAVTKSLADGFHAFSGRFASLEGKLERVSAGPNLAQWSGWAAAIGGALWLLFTSRMDGDIGRLDAINSAQDARLAQQAGYMADLYARAGSHDVALAEVGVRVKDLDRWDLFAWQEWRVQLEEHKGEKRAALQDLRDDMAGRFDRNERDINELRAGREGDITQQRAAAVADKDALERELMGIRGDVGE